MRKMVLIVGIVLCAAMLRAGEYAYMVFVNTAGTSTALPVSGMTMEVNGSELVVNQADGSARFVLTQLKEMYFSEQGAEVTALDHVLWADESVQVFSATGVKMGVFGSLKEASQNLNSGAYVVSNGSETIKMVVR